MTQLLLLFDLLNDVLSASDTQATESGTVAADLAGDSPTHHRRHTPTNDGEDHLPPSSMDRVTHTPTLHMDKDFHSSFQGGDRYVLTREVTSSVPGMPSHVGAAHLGRTSCHWLSPTKDVGKWEEVAGEGQPAILSSAESQEKVITPKRSQSNSQCQSDPKIRVAQLIGKRCLVSCSINRAHLQMLLDSGAQVTMRTILGNLEDIVELKPVQQSIASPEPRSQDTPLPGHAQTS
ncbi:uncharacterized protein LOC113082045 [Tachysurus ichikawai]